MKRFGFIVALCAFVAMPVEADLVHSANAILGNQPWSAVGLEFTVNPGPGILVTDLGVYDDGANGIVGVATLSTLLFSTGNPVPLAQASFTAGLPGVLDPASNYRFLPIAPLVLPPGSYTIMGYGFDDLNMEHNLNVTPPGPTFDPGGSGAITFVQSVWTDNGAVPPALPTFTGAPDYFDGPNVRFLPLQAVPVPGAVLLGFLGLGIAGMKLRKSV